MRIRSSICMRIKIGVRTGNGKRTRKMLTPAPEDAARFVKAPEVDELFMKK